MELAAKYGRRLAGLALAGMSFVVVVPPALSQDPLARAASASAHLASARAAFETLPEAERVALQDGLIWLGLYNGLADGVFGRQTFDALAAWQQTRRKPPTGSLTPSERADLQTAAQRPKKAAGFVILDDRITGIRLGVPVASLPKTEPNTSGGSRWQSTDDKVTLDTRLAPPDATLEALYERNLASKAPGRIVTYKILRPTFLVIAGETDSGKFYTRYDSDGSGLRGFSIGYDKTLAPQVDRLVVAIANSFEPFPATSPIAIAPASPSPAQQSQSAPPGRHLIGTGIVIAPGSVFTTVSLATCRNPQIGGIPVEPGKAAPSEAGRLIALPRTIGKPPVGISRGVASKDATVIMVGYATDHGEVTLSVVPGIMADERSVLAPLQPGFGGAPVFDTQNRLLGMVASAAGDSRKIAGISTTARYGVVEPDIRMAASNAPQDVAPGEAEEGASALVSVWKPALVPITCLP